MVSHGAVRTAEVTARFTLDALPGKQMAIDADLNAGIIDESQARARGGILRRHCSDTRLFRQHPFHGSWQTAFLRAASVVHCVGNHVGAGGDSGAAQILLLFLAGLVGALAWRTPPAAAQAAQEENEKQKDKKPTQEVEDLLKLDELALEVGYGLVSVVDAQRGGQLLARVKALRSNLAVQLGFIVPPVHITDNARLAPRGLFPPYRMMRWPKATRWWTRRRCWRHNLAEIIKKYAPELLTRNETKRLLDRLAESQPKLVEELTPKLLSLAEVQKVMQQLLREAVSIRDLSTILEALFDSAALTKSPVMLVEAARQALARALVRPLSLPSSGEITRRLPISSELISPKSFCRSVKVTPSSCHTAARPL